METTITSRYRLIIQHLTPDGWQPVDLQWFDDEFVAMTAFLCAPLPVGVTGVTLTDMVTGSTLYADNQAGRVKEIDINIPGELPVDDALI